MSLGSEKDRENKRLGRAGENKACNYLKKSGYKILKRNYKSPFGEVDIIAGKEDVIAFIEVKTRRSDAYGQPSESVTKERKAKYINGANYFFAGKDIDCTVRFDIIEILCGKINHIENAFNA